MTTDNHDREQLRELGGDRRQPPPEPGKGDLWQDVMADALRLIDRPAKFAMLADMERRRLVGIERYGTPLQAHNGREALVDAYEESLDLDVYLRQGFSEDPTPELGELYTRALWLTADLRSYIEDQT